MTPRSLPPLYSSRYDRARALSSFALVLDKKKKKNYEIQQHDSESSMSSSEFAPSKALEYCGDFVKHLLA